MTQDTLHAVTGGDARRRMEELAPPALAEKWDNVGWQVGHDAAPVRAVLVSLDVDQSVVEEALHLGANMVVSHHPLWLKGPSHIDPSGYLGSLLRTVLSEEVHLYAAHTNLDAVAGGVNGALAERLGLEVEGPLVPMPGLDPTRGFGALCTTSPVSVAEVVRRAVEQLGCGAPRVTPALVPPSSHTRVALLGGSGASMLGDVVRAGCTLYITGEVKYHDAQDAARQGVTLIEVGHFHSERPVLERVATWLAPLNIPIYQSRKITSPFAMDQEAQ